MKKRKLALTGLFGFAFLFGCSQTEGGEAMAGSNTPSGFTIVTEDKVQHGIIRKVKDDVTGCYYILGTSKGNSSTTVSATQMFIEKDGVSVPYCEK